MGMERNRVLRLVDRLASPGYDIELVNKQNLEVLNREPRTPAVIYSNHSATEDPLLLCLAIFKESPDSMGKLIVPVSEHHARFKNFPAYSIGVGFGRSLGFEMPEVVQSYRRKGSPDDAELQKKSSNLNMGFARLIMEKIPEGARVIIYPEGHRNPDATLLPAETGLGFIQVAMEKLKGEGKIENGYFIPVHASYSKEGHGLKYSLKDKTAVTLEFGQPLTIDDVTREAANFGDKRQQSRIASHVLMHHIAEMMPAEKQGFYAPEFYPDTMAGRYELRSDENGQVFVFDNYRSDIIK